MIMALAILMQAAGAAATQPATAPTASSAPAAVASAPAAPTQFRKKCHSVSASYSRTLRRVCENIPIVPATTEAPAKPADSAR